MWIVLALEAGVLLVAANTGFLGGPAVLASMATDRWVPRQFRQLSSRMVTQNGVLVMGISALMILLMTRGRSEEHTSELQSLMRISYAVFCLKKKKQRDLLHTFKRKHHTITHK